MAERRTSAREDKILIGLQCLELRGQELPMFPTSRTSSHSGTQTFLPPPTHHSNLLQTPPHINQRAQILYTTSCYPEVLFLLLCQWLLRMPIQRKKVHSLFNPWKNERRKRSPQVIVLYKYVLATCLALKYKQVNKA
jgi:hypothetical protein